MLLFDQDCGVQSMDNRAAMPLYWAAVRLLIFFEEVSYEKKPNKGGAVAAPRVVRGSSSGDALH